MSAPAAGANARCHSCFGSDFDYNDLGYLVCQDCGVQSHVATQEQTEYDQVAKGLRRLTQTQDAEPGSSSRPDNCRQTSTSSLLATVQQVLFVQAKAFIEHAQLHYGLFEAIGSLFLALLEGWRQTSNDRPFVVCFRTDYDDLRESSFEVTAKTTLAILGLACNLERVPVTFDDIAQMAIRGIIPTRRLREHLRPDVAADMSPRLQAFVEWQGLPVGHALEREANKIHRTITRICSLEMLPEMVPFCSNVPMLIARYVERLGLPCGVVAPTCVSLLRLYQRVHPDEELNSARIVAVIVIGIKLLYGCRSSAHRTAFDDWLSRLQSVPDCRNPPGDSDDAERSVLFVDWVHDYEVVHHYITLLLSEYDELFVVPERTTGDRPGPVPAHRNDMDVYDDVGCDCWIDPNDEKSPAPNEFVTYANRAIGHGSCEYHFRHQRLVSACVGTFGLSGQLMNLFIDTTLMEIYSLQTGNPAR
ncbi:TFIIB-type domain-containing protein [Plasmodiophora brassicae]